MPRASPHPAATSTSSRGSASEIAEALEAAHATGIIHRDLEPANIWITDTGQPKVHEFGLAKLVDDPQAQPEHATVLHAPALVTGRGQTFGTAAYMCPERAPAASGCSTR